MDFEKIFAAKKKAGMKHIIVEVEDYNFTPIVSVQKSLEFLLGSRLCEVDRHDMAGSCILHSHNENPAEESVSMTDFTLAGFHNLGHAPDLA